MPTHDSHTNSVDIGALEALIDDRFPQIHSGGRIFTIEAAASRSARVRMRMHERVIRSGGTISGPAMFTLADFSTYVAIIATLGEAGFDAVTTNLNINFLTRPEAHDMVSSVRLIRVGRGARHGELRPADKVTYYHKWVIYYHRRNILNYSSFSADVLDQAGPLH